MAWLVIDPEEGINVSWHADYEVYQSRSIPKPDATIVTSAVTQHAQVGHVYTYLPAGHFAPGQPFQDPHAYAALNNDDRHKTAEMTFGLVQAALVSGANKLSPINAQMVPYQQTAGFTPEERLLVFVSGITDNGVVISDIASRRLEIDFTQQPAQKAGWSPDEGQFVLLP